MVETPQTNNDAVALECVERAEARIQSVLDDLRDLTLREDDLVRRAQFESFVARLDDAAGLLDLLQHGRN